MSNWKVSKTKISLFVHPNADSLSIGKVGSYQVVVQKGIYNDGDEVIFVPEKSVLTGNLKVECVLFKIGDSSLFISYVFRYLIGRMGIYIKMSDQFFINA